MNIKEQIFLGLLLIVLLVGGGFVFYLDADTKNNPKYKFKFLESVNIKFTGNNNFYSLCNDQGLITGINKDGTYQVQIFCGDFIHLTVKEEDITKLNPPQEAKEESKGPMIPFIISRPR